MNPLDQWTGTPILAVLWDLLASGISGFCFPPILCGIAQLMVAIRRPALVADARWLALSVGVASTIGALARAADSPLGITTPASESTLYAHAFVYGLMPAFVASAFSITESALSLILRWRQPGQ